MKIITILILLFLTITFADHPDTTLSKLQQRKELIELDYQMKINSYQLNRLTTTIVLSSLYIPLVANLFTSSRIVKVRSFGDK